MLKFNTVCIVVYNEIKLKFAEGKLALLELPCAILTFLRPIWVPWQHSVGFLHLEFKAFP